MSANDNKRYYWLKLKKDFFQQHQIKVLKSLPNGRLYALIYLELLAESCSHSGELRYSNLMPYDIVTLSAVIDEDKDNVEKAIETFIRLELVEIVDDGTIYMREIEKLIGSETGQTIRKREKRVEGKIGVKNTLEYRDKNIEIRREIYKDIETLRSMGFDREVETMQPYIEIYDPDFEDYKKIKDAVFDPNVRHLNQYIEKIMEGKNNE